MLRRAVFFTLLILVSLVAMPPDARASCSVTQYCPSSCSLSLTCPNTGQQISCTNVPTPYSVTCNGVSSCSTGQQGSTYIQKYVQCDGSRVYCYPYACSQGYDWIQCNNPGPVTCSGGGNVE